MGLDDSNWADLAQNLDKWSALINMAVNLEVP
jgi:hypothetical protein